MDKHLTLLELQEMQRDLLGKAIRLAEAHYSYTAGILLLAIGDLQYREDHLRKFGKMV